MLSGVTYHPVAGTPPLQAYPAQVFDPAQPGETTPPG